MTFYGQTDRSDKARSARILRSCTERGISLFVCLVAGNKIVEIVGLQPPWAVVSLPALCTLIPPKTLALTLHYLLRSVLFFIDSSI